MPPHALLDSHVHLWPASAANSASHAWMTPEHEMAVQFSVQDYLAAASRAGVTPDVPPTTSKSADSVDPTSTTAHESDPEAANRLLGLIYIETDRALGSPSLPASDRWTQPLEEIVWLRRLVEGSPLPGEGHTAEHAELLRGLVPWAPIDQGPEVLARYFERVREVGGEVVWARIKGWRFLLQGIRERRELEEMVLGGRFLGALRMLGSMRRGWVFEVGVDQHSGGTWQLEVVVEMVRRVREGGAGGGERDGEGVTFILNHLCKPHFSHAHLDDWKRSTQRLAAFPNVYMKLSGAFSELPPQTAEAPASAEVIYAHTQPWIEEAVTRFTYRRIMYGSDWPICNIGGPGTEESWASWHAVVEHTLEQLGLPEEERQWVWWKTAAEAYQLDNLLG